MILVWNPGSSSLKYEIFETDRFLRSKQSGSVSLVVNSGISGHDRAVRFLYSHIVDSGLIDQIKMVGVRVVHGGGAIRDEAEISDEILAKISELSKFAPLHNPGAVLTIKESKKIFKVPHRAFFDTAFFEKMPIEAKKYPIPEIINEEIAIQKYGFHGISHEYIYNTAGGEKLGKTITLHLGAGSSVCAIFEGRPIDTSMGFTPSEGLIMQTRAGDIDSGLVLYLAKEKGIAETDKILNNKSGLAGVSETSGEMLDILYLSGIKIQDDEYKPPKKLKKSPEGEKLAKMALTMFIRRIQKYIGSYAALMNGVDTIVFSGKIGYGSGEIRKIIMDKMDFLGDVKCVAVEPDEERAIANKLVK
mgnify:CR=1 FL=1